jgi:hypothetical protein
MPWQDQLQVLLMVLVAGLSVGMIVLLVQVHRLRADVENYSGASTPVDSGYDWRETADVCRMLGALAKDSGIKVATLFNDVDGLTNCAQLAVDPAALG